MQTSARKRETRIQQLISEKEECTQDFMHAVRSFKMSTRGVDVLHVVKPGTPGVAVEPVLQEAVAYSRRNGKVPKVISAGTVVEAKLVIDAKLTEIRIAVIEADIDYILEGVDLVAWIKSNHPQLPVLLATTSEEQIPIIRRDLPYIDIFLAGSMTTAQLMSLFGSILGCSDK